MILSASWLFSPMNRNLCFFPWKAVAKLDEGLARDTSLATVQ